MKPCIRTLSIITSTAFMLGISACSDDSNDAERDINLTTGNAEPAPGRLGGTMANDYRDISVDITPYATVVFNAADGSRASGNVQFVAEESSVRIFGRLANLPEGTHGLHILPAGDCSEATGIASSRISDLDSAAQGDGAALPANSGYIGDISVGPDKLASFELENQNLMLEGPDSIVGKPMIVGAAGDIAALSAGQTVGDHSNVIACGVIALNDVTAAPDAAP